MSIVTDFSNINKRLRKKRPLPAGWSKPDEYWSGMVLVKGPTVTGGMSIYCWNPASPLPEGAYYCDENGDRVDTPIYGAQFE